MSALPVPWTWSERTPDGTHAVLRLPVDLGADHMAGHYPGHPILPAVVVMDWVQQAVDSLHGSGLQLRRLERARFVRPLFPGDILELTLRMRPRRPNGEETDGEGTDGKGTDGKGTDGEGTDGKGTDGEGTDGEGTDGEGIFATARIVRSDRRLAVELDATFAPVGTHA
jgi:hypothetical protein